MTTRQYIGARYIPVFADPVEWTDTRTYEPLMMVQHLGETYMTKQAVPLGVQLPDTSQGEESNEFWVHMSNWNAQVETYRQEVLQYNGRISTVENDLPIGEFDSVNTVKSAIDETNNLLPASSFDSVNTVAAAISGEASAREEQDDLRVIVFDTVADMKASSDIKTGYVCRTNGFHSSGDGGGAWYKIANTGTANEMDVIECGELFANLITQEVMTLEMFGAHGDGVTDDTDILNYVFGNGNFKIVSNKGKNYLCSETVEIKTRRSIDFGFGKITFTNSGTYGVWVNAYDESTVSHERFGAYVENMVIDGGDTSIAFQIYQTYKTVFNNIYIVNFNNVGLCKDGGYEIVVDNIYVWASKDSASAIGVWAKDKDSQFGNLFGCNCHTGVKISGAANHFNSIHMWLFKDTGRTNGNALWQDSCMIEHDINAGTESIFIDYVYIDCYHYGVKLNGYADMYINNVYWLCSDMSDLSSDFATLPIEVLHPVDSAHLGYLNRIHINYFNGKGTTVNTATVIPTSYSYMPLPINDITCQTGITNNVPSDFIDTLTFTNCTLMHGTMREIGDRLLLLDMKIKTSSTSMPIVGFPTGWLQNKDVNYECFGYSSTSSYGNSANIINLNKTASNIAPLNNPATADLYIFVTTTIKY